MTKTRFTPWVVLACIGTLAGCTSGEGGPAGNTELNVVVPNGAVEDPITGEFSTPGEIDIQVVEYTINCDAPDPTATDLGVDTIEPTFNPDVTINGVLEVLDTASGGVNTQDFGVDLDEVYVWQGFMDIPLNAVCTVQLRARDDDGEVICTDTVDFDTEPPFVAGDTIKVNVLMYCGISFQAPVASLDLDGDFSFNISNFCPDLFVLNCIDSEIDIRTIPGIGEVAATACQVRARDGDSQCGDSCDPQTCVADTEGLTCTAAPDPMICSADSANGDAGKVCTGQFMCNGLAENAGDLCTQESDCTPIAGTSPPVMCDSVQCELPGSCVPRGPQTTVSCGPSVCNLPGSPFNGGACTIGDSTTCGGNPAACTPNPVFVCAIPGALFGTSCDPTDATNVCTANGACVPNAVLDCTGTNTPAGACVFDGDVVGGIGDPAPGPLAPGDGGFFVACVTADNDGDLSTPAVAVTPGATVTCQAVTTDGDYDCDKVKTVDVTCPGLSPCEIFGGNAACQDLAPSDICTSSVCNELTCDQTAAGCCVDTAINEGGDCSSEQPPVASCAGGDCVSGSCADGLPDPDTSCDKGNECTTDSCNLTSGLCEAVNVVDGTSCNTNAGTCQSPGGVPGDSVCVGNCATTVCNSPPTGDAQCQDAVCNAAGNSGNVCPDNGVCCSYTTDDTNTCDICTSGTCQCDTGDCVDGLSCPPAAIPPTVVRAACRNSFNQASSTFPIQLGIALDDCAVAGADFDATIDPIIALDTAFLQAAADTLCALGTALTSADVSIAQIGIEPRGGTTTCDPVLSELPAAVLPLFVSIPVIVTGVCGSGGSVEVTGGVSLTLPTVTTTCRAGASGELVTYCPTGSIPIGDPVTPPPANPVTNIPQLNLGVPPANTWVGVSVPANVTPPPIQVVFECEAPGTVFPTPGSPDLECFAPNANGGPCAGLVGVGDMGETTNTCSNVATGVVPPDTVTPCPWTDDNGYNISDCDFQGFPGTCTAVPRALPLTECLQFDVVGCITDLDCNLDADGNPTQTCVGGVCQ